VPPIASPRASIQFVAALTDGAAETRRARETQRVIIEIEAFIIYILCRLWCLRQKNPLALVHQ
jgi:hypothetical protein